MCTSVSCGRENPMGEGGGVAIAWTTTPAPPPAPPPLFLALLWLLLLLAVGSAMVLTLGAALVAVLAAVPMASDGGSSRGWRTCEPKSCEHGRASSSGVAEVRMWWRRGQYQRS